MTFSRGSVLFGIPRARGSRNHRVEVTTPCPDTTNMDVEWPRIWRTSPPSELFCKLSIPRVHLSSLFTGYPVAESLSPAGQSSAAAQFPLQAIYEICRFISLP